MRERHGPAEGYLPIGAYGLLGDCHTAALVSDDGSIDWYCPGRFDAPAVFCRLLDAASGGSFRIGPAGAYAVERRYRDPSAVLETTFQMADGRIRLTDFMSVQADAEREHEYDLRSQRRLVRLVEGLAGEPELALRFHPTFDYARARAELRLLDGRAALASDGGQYLALRCPDLPLELDERGRCQVRFRVPAGRRYWFVLAGADDEQEALSLLDQADGPAELQQTLDCWRSWTDRLTYQGTYREQVLRSALVLRLLTYDPTGAIVAAPTTSLPERIGGVRNWDYRYTWLRDASMILYALLTVGYHDDAADFFEWLEQVEQRNPDAVPQIMYAVDGGQNLTETSLDHLEGYRCSRPVRIGNAAARQRQLDIFGEVLGAAFLYFSASRPHQRDPRVAKSDGSPTGNTWQLLHGLVEQAARLWQQPDRGIWEVRAEPKLFLYSRLRCWVALDRGLKLASRYGLEAPLDRWRSVRDQICQAILTRGYNAERGAFTQAFGSRELDASALVIPRLGLLPPTDPRVQSTIERIQSELMANGLVYRYLADDGLPGHEATFALCSYWLVDALALSGQLDQAHQLFERVNGYANDLGLLAEEIDPTTGELLGNFPQGFSHLALVNAAVNLAKAERHGPEQRAEDESERASKAGPSARAGGADRR